MTLGQKIIILIGMLLALGMGAYPPWQHVLQVPSMEVSLNPAGYAPINQPPPALNTQRLGLKGATAGVRIDMSRMAVQWGTLVLLTAGFVLLFQERKSAKEILALAKHKSAFDLVKGNDGGNGPAFSTSEDSTPTPVAAGPPPSFTTDDEG